VWRLIEEVEEDRPVLFVNEENESTDVWLHLPIEAGLPSEREPRHPAWCLNDMEFGIIEMEVVVEMTPDEVIDLWELAPGLSQFQEDPLTIEDGRGINHGGS